MRALGIATLCGWLVATAAIGQHRSLDSTRSVLERAAHEAATRVAAFSHSNQARLSDIAPLGSVLVDITPSGLPVYRSVFNAGAAQTTGVTKLGTPGQSGLLLEGEGMVVAVWDNGKVKNHVEFGNRVIAIEGTEPADHATHVTGTLIASGVNPLAKGMAPKAQAATYFFGNDDHVMAGLAKPDQTSLLFSNHSYGTVTGWFRNGSGWRWAGDIAQSNVEDYRFGFYGQRARDLDEIAYLAPYYSIFWAAGNDRAEPGDGSRPADCNAGTGYDCIIPDAVGKNIFTIGAVNKVLDYVSPASVVMGNYSSWGPTDDGRIKPDLVGAGTDLFSTSANGDNGYEVLGGTSMATPNVAGSLLLVQELYAKLNGGRFMKSASLKALAIHTAKEAGNFPGPDYSFGWGLVDAEAAANFLMRSSESSGHLMENSLQNGEAHQQQLTARQGTKVTITIAWTDPPATPLQPSLDPASPRLVHDLDLRVTDANEVEHQPWILDPNNPVRQAFKGDNFRDNVEKIEFTAPNDLPMSLTVRHKGQLQHAQDYTLVISYTPAAEQGVYYWTGGSGYWNDPAHWSAQSGGAGSTTVPVENDLVIFDENSFTAPDQIVTLADDVEVRELKWMSTADGQVNLAGHTLQVSGALSFSSSYPIFEDGVIRFAGNGQGRVGWKSSATQPIKLEWSQGHWLVNGVLNVREVALVGGEVTMNDLRVQAQSFIASSEATGSLDRSVFGIDEKLELNGGANSVTSYGASLQTEANAALLLNDSEWQGTVSVMSGSLLLSGSYSIDSLVVASEAVVQTSGEVGTLLLTAGAALKLSEQVQLTLEELVIESSADKVVQLSGSASSALVLSTRKKYCFDYVTINSLNVAGPAVANAGDHSTVSNSSNWRTLPCESVLFIDFTVSYPCLGGVLLAMPEVPVGADGLEWTIQHAGETRNSSSESLSLTLLSAEPYVISLHSQLGDQQDVAIKSISPQANSIADFSITSTQDQLFAVAVADSYQWFRNEEPITGETSRSFAFGGEDGLYQVLAAKGECNRLSETFTVTKIDESQPQGTIAYPNPANDKIFIRSREPVRSVEVFTATGLKILSSQASTFDCSDLSDGLYLVKVTTLTSTSFQKIVVSHTIQK